MSSHGKVLDLLDDRYLNLQDVTGNVEPFPKLVPYEQYTQNMIAYRMDTKHEILLGLIQDFTDRISQSLSKELWTWCVQWEVEDAPSNELVVTPAAKKPRMDLQPGSDGQSEQRKPPAYTIVERRCLHPELFGEPDMLRILIDIVQVDSRLVPNYVEFLYQWIDYYEGDGKALKAALRMEIPSLWEFEYHPLPLVFKRPTRPGLGPKGTDKKDGEEKGGERDQLEEAAEKIGEKVTRTKPDLIALEAATEESERLQYREPKFGIQPPIDPRDEPLPPLINIPQDKYERRRYYASCFKNRQRAFWLLQEAGVSARQIANYRKLQKEDPRETPEDSNGNGFSNYYRDEPYAHEHFMKNEQIARIREKQREIAISNRLAMEARLAAANQANVGAESSNQRALPPPLIPVTPTYPSRPDLVAKLQGRMRALAQGRDPTIRLVPGSVHGRTKSKAFAYAGGSRNVIVAPRHPSQIPGWPWHNGEQDDSEEGDSDEGDDDSDDMDEGDGGGGPMGVPASTQPALPAPMQPPTLPTAAPIGRGVPTFMRSLNRTQLSSLMPLLTNAAQQAAAQRTPALQPSPQPAPPDPTAGRFARHTVIGGPAPPGYQLPVPADTAAGAAQPQNVQTGPRSASDRLAVFLRSYAALPADTIATGRPAPPGFQQPMQTNPAPGAQSSHGAQLPVPPNPPAGAVRSQNPQPGPPWASSQSIGVNAGLSTAMSRPAAIPTQLPLPSSTVAGMMRPRNTQLAPPIAPPIAPPVISVTPPTATTAQGQSAQNASAPGSQSQGLISSSRLQQFMAEQRVPTLPRAPSVSLTPPRNSGTSVLRPTQSTPQNPTPFALRPVPAPLNLPFTHLALQPNLPTIRRNPNPSSPLSLTPLAAHLGSNLTVASSQADSPHGLPIQIYVPKVVLADTATPFTAATDCLLLGYTRPGTQTLALSKAIFFPVGVWENTLNRVRKGHYTVLETYSAPANHPRFASHFSVKGVASNNLDEVKGPHKHVYDKLVQVYGFMTGCLDREEEVTKRWRSTRGPLTATKRGAVWEGWGLWVDRGVEMGPEERMGAMVSSSVDEDADGKEDEEAERRRREMEELMDEQCGDLSDEEMED